MESSTKYFEERDPLVSELLSLATPFLLFGAMYTQKAISVETIVLPAIVPLVLSFVLARVLPKRRSVVCEVAGGSLRLYPALLPFWWKSIPVSEIEEIRVVKQLGRKMLFIFQRNGSVSTSTAPPKDQEFIGFLRAALPDVIFAGPVKNA